MSLVAPWVLMAIGAAVTPLTGTVVDAGGAPAGGVSVWLTADGNVFPDPPAVLAHGESDDQGRFTLDRPAGRDGGDRRGPPTLWAYRRGSGLVLKTPTAGDGPVRLALGPAAGATVRVFGADGGAVAATVRLLQIRERPGMPPDAVVDRLAATTDADGRAAVDGVRPEDVVSVVVTAAGARSQNHWFFPPAASEKVVSLHPVGRVEGRVVGDDAGAARGWVVTVTARSDEPGYRGGDVCRGRVTTGEDGRFTFDALAEGTYALQVEPPEGSAYLTVRPDMGKVVAGETAAVEIRAVRGVRVEGVVREQGGTKPVVGVKVLLAGLTSGGATHYPVTDDEGRYSCLVLPGKFDVAILDAPDTHCKNPVSPAIPPFVLAAGQGPLTLPPIELSRAARVRVAVVDEAGHLVPDADVTGNWSDPGSRHGATGFALRADESGSFELGGVVPGSTVVVTASLGRPPRAQASVRRTVTAGEKDSLALTVRLRRAETAALRGRVIDPDGRPVAGALVRVQFRPAGLINGRPLDVRFGGDEETRTGADGTFRTPDQLPVGYEYRVTAAAPGSEPGESGWVGSPEAGPQDVVLRPAARLRPVAGRVTDREGKPVAGAEVFQSGDGPVVTKDTTDGAGRFRVPGVVDAPALVFVRKGGYRFTGRVVGRGEAEVEVVVSRSDEPPPPAPAEPPVSRRDEQALAYELVAPARARLIAGVNDDPDRPRALGVMALLDPGWVVAKVGGPAVADDPGLLSDVAVGFFLEDASGALEALDALVGPGAASAALLAVHDRGAGATEAERRGLLDNAAMRARQATSRSDRAASLARVADRWLDLGETGRAGPPLGEARGLAAVLPKRFDLHPHGELAEALAWSDLPAALGLLEGPGVAPDLDLRRAGVAVRAAADDPDGSERLLGQITDRRLRNDARRAACVRLAARDLPRARVMAAAGSVGPLAVAALPAAAARGKVSADPEGAKALLAEAFDRLERLAGRTDPTSPASPAVEMARLLPLAARVDPGRYSEYLWRSLAARPPRDPSPPPPAVPVRISLRARDLAPYVHLAELAALVSRDDPAAAGAVFSPVAARRVPSLVDEASGLGGAGGAIFHAAAVVDPRVARSMLDALPDDPEPPPVRGSVPPRRRPRPKADARLTVARALALPPALRRRPDRRFGDPEG